MIAIFTDNLTCIPFKCLKKVIKLSCFSLSVQPCVNNIDYCGYEPYFGRHVLTVLLCGVDQSLVQIHHQNQLPVPVEPFLVFTAKLLCLLKINK